MPPIEPPITQNRSGMPRWSSSAAWARTMSAMVTTGKRRFHGWPVAGSMAERAGRAHAAAEHVDADDEVARRIERPCPARPGSSHQPSLPVTGCSSATNWSPRQRVADQDGVRLVGVERAVGLVGHAIGAELDAAVEPQRPLDAQDRVAAPGQRLAFGFGQGSSSSGLSIAASISLLGRCQRKSPRPEGRGLFRALRPFSED